MKNLLLGISLTANIALAYLLIQDKDELKHLTKIAESKADQFSGKVRQVKGAVTGDTGDKAAGNFETGKGKVKEFAEDAKDDLKDTFDES